MSMTLNFTASALAMIKSFEGLRLDAYRDIAGVWTIGYGHTDGLALVGGDTITEPQAEALLKSDLASFEAVVTQLTSQAPATTDTQFSAMVSLCYNIGVGAFRSSSVLRQHIAGNYPQAALAFLLWDKAHVDGQLVEVAGLLRRRKAEAALYQEDDL